MKKIVFFCLLFNFLSLSCTQKASNTKPTNQLYQKMEQKNLLPTPPEKITLTGKFESTKGVMTQLSCFCYNGGYLITEGGKKVAVCFPKDEEEIPCTLISIVGEYVTETKDSDPNGVCAGGTITYLSVSSFECMGK